MQKDLVKVKGGEKLGRLTEILTKKREIMLGRLSKKSLIRASREIKREDTLIRKKI